MSVNSPRGAARASIAGSPTARLIARNCVVYGIAGAIIWYEVRGLNLHLLLSVFGAADLRWFVPTTVVSFAVWFFGENLMFSKAFSYFHRPTGYGELMPVTAAAYFLQVLNLLAAAGAFMLFLHRRKEASWLGAGFTLLFLNFIDGLVLSGLALAAGLLIPHSPLRGIAPYAAGTLAALILIAAWWRWRTPRLRIERWLYERPSLVSFRTANLHIYLVLILIRIAIFVPQGFVYYLSLRAFHAHTPLTTVLAVTPAMLAASGTPLTPVGLGPFQAVAMEELRAYAAPARIMAVFLALSMAMLLYRVLLGLGAAGVFAGEVMSEGTERDEARREPQNSLTAGDRQLRRS